MHRDKRTSTPEPESGLRIRLFGGMAIVDGQGVDYLPRSRKTRALVALLTMMAPKSAQRGQITALLWSQREIAQGRASLRQAVHELQHALGSAWSHVLVAERHCLAIDLRGVSVDAVEATGAAAPRTALLTLFEEGYLEDLGGLDPAFDAWLCKERRRMAAIARKGGEAFLEEGHPRDVTILATRSLLRLDPLHDGAWRVLIEAHIEAGDRAAARFACEQWGTAMNLSPDEVPPPELSAFLARIRFGSGYRPPGGQRTWAPAHGVAEDVITPDRAPAPTGTGEPVGAPPAFGQGQFNLEWVVPAGLLSDGVTPGRIMPEGIMPEGIVPEGIVPEGIVPEGIVSGGSGPGGTIAGRGPLARMSPDPGGSGWSIPDDAAVLRGVAENVTVPDRAVEYLRAPHRIMPGGATRDRVFANQTFGRGVMEDLVLPGRGMPRTAGQALKPNLSLVPRDRTIEAEVWDISAASWSGAERGRSSLRLGIREMRVIGPNVDPALAPGLAEEITVALSRFKWLSCVSAASTGAIDGEIGVSWPEANLDLLLDGTIQSSEDRVRITVRLVDLRAGEAIIWAKRFNHDASDTMAVQDRVAAAIVAQLDPLLLIREGERAATGSPHGASAQELVLQAVPAIYRMDRLSFHAAGELLEAALRVDPTHTGALAWLAYWHLFLVGQGWAGDPDAATRRAGLLADTAVAMDPNDARALTLAGHVRGFLLRRPAEAAVLHERAISLNPNLAIAWCFSGFTLSYLGDHATALARMTKAIELSPHDPHLFFFRAAVIMPRLLLGEYEQAAAAGREAIELNPWFSSSFKGCLAALGHLGLAKEAAGVMTRLLKMEPAFTVQAAIRRSPMNLAADVERYADGLRRAGLPER